jgi:hypothetical protein
MVPQAYLHDQENHVQSSYPCEVPIFLILDTFPLRQLGGLCATHCECSRVRLDIAVGANDGLDLLSLQWRHNPCGGLNQSVSTACLFYFWLDHKAFDCGHKGNHLIFRGDMWRSFWVWLDRLLMLMVRTMAICFSVSLFWPRVQFFSSDLFSCSASFQQTWLAMIAWLILGPVILAYSGGNFESGETMNYSIVFSMLDTTFF